tara:strand:- start:617 stop:1420 length:804 start_codon:yes stop_codon:yes gene_type:complete
MPFLARRCGAKIAYETKGSGFPVLLIAPGGMTSCLANWAGQPFDPWTQLSTSKFRLIAMDQRNGGHSTGPLRPSEGWRTMLEDQLALLDHLGIERCHTVGSCIGPSYQLQLMREQPHRFTAAVLMQPIGLAHHTTEPGQPWQGRNTAATRHWFGSWAQELARQGRAEESELRTLSDAMFGKRDFVFSVSRDDVLGLSTPMQVLMGKDIFHPSQISRELASLAPNTELIESWRDDAAQAAAAAVRIDAFLTKHTPTSTGACESSGTST